MKTTLLCLFLLTLNFNSFAQIDYKVGNAARTYPTALSFKGELGYAQKIWGDTKGINYGYVRPSLTAQTSAVVNYVHTRLEFYPISFFGINIHDFYRIFLIKKTI